MNKITSLEICCDGCTYLYVWRQEGKGRRYNIADTQRLDRVRALIDRPPDGVSFGMNGMWLFFKIRPEHLAKEETNNETL